MRSGRRGVAWCVGIFLIVTSAVSSAADKPRFTRSEVEVDVPGVTLIDQNGREVELRNALLGDKPVFVEFIFATCTTICPVLSAGFASVQRKLGDDSDDILLVSLTIDPEHDGPAEMRAYLERYGAGPGWDFYTGTRTDMDSVMRAFDAYVADKMSHRPLTFVHAPGQKGWVRIDGFAGSRDLMEEVEWATGEEAPHGRD